MLKVGDIIRCKPSITAKDPPRQATVVYIHPEGRFYTVEFKCANGGSFRETREFTPAEMEEAYRLGIFKRPEEIILFDPAQKRREMQSQQWRNNHRPVEDPEYVDEEDDISTLMAMF